MSSDIPKRGYEIYDRLKTDLLKNHEFDMIFIDCLSGDYVIQGKSETRSDAEARLLARRPGAEIFMEQIVKDDFAYSLPNLYKGETVRPIGTAELPGRGN